MGFIEALKGQPAQGQQQGLPLNPAYKNEEIQQSKQDAALVQWQMDTDDIYQNVRHSLKGEVAVIDQQKGMILWEKRNKAMMCDEAIDDVIGALSFFNRNIIMSNLEMKEIEWMIFDVRMDLASEFVLKRIKYGFKHGEMTKICDFICTFVYAMLKRAHGAGERNTMKYSMSSTTMFPMEQKRKKLFGIL